MKRNTVTIKDVALKAGVSISVVSYVLNETPGKTLPDITKDKVFKAAKELNYTPNAIARGMRTKKAMSIGIVSFWNIKDPVFIDILEGVSKIADENDYTIVFCNLKSPRKEFKYAELFKKRLIDGIIFISPHENEKAFNEKEHLDLIKELGIPTVILNGYTKDEEVSYIYFDYYSTSYMATEYLIKNGHRNIGYLLSRTSEINQQQSKDRYKGFCNAMANNSIKIQKNLIFKGDNFETIVEIMKNKSLMTAIVGNKSNYASDLIKYLNENDIKVPSDLSIIATNSEHFAPYIVPPITTVSLPMIEIGEKAVKILIDCFENKSYKARLSLSNFVIERESCKKIN